MWVIHDFPAYGNMVGCTAKGFYACPICGRNTDSEYLKCCIKCVYMGHKIYLPLNHKYRYRKGPFNGKLEHHTTPKIVQVEDIFVETKGKEESWGRVKVKK